MHHFTGMFVVTKYITFRGEKFLSPLIVSRHFGLYHFSSAQTSIYLLCIYTHLLTSQAVCEHGVFAAPRVGNGHFNTQVCVCLQWARQKIICL